MSLTLQQATDRAHKAGATKAEIDAYARVFQPQVGSVAFRNTITALNLHSWLNTREDWARLAGALKARKHVHP